MKEKKIFLLLFDGLGLRNFAFTRFNEIGIEKKIQTLFWNSSVFPIAELGFKEIKIKNAKIYFLTDVLKHAKNHITLNLFTKINNDEIYQRYKFPFSYRNLKTLLKSILCNTIILFFSNQKGLKMIDKMINSLERKTVYYSDCKNKLKEEMPQLVFSSTQRLAQAIAPLLAAKDLGIPTASFIFSWDNLPKATMVVETDYYFVWSEYMKHELLHYHPSIKENRIVVTGTPQFEFHFEKKDLMSREVFFKTYSLEHSKKYICFSGDDETTSPDDPKYLEDLAMTIERLNKKKYNLGIIFRRCPVDFSSRYDEILKKYSRIIVPIDPLWKPIRLFWSTILPTKEDGVLFSNIAEHCEMVVNLGSTTLFDFVAHNKPCGYFRYNQKFQNDKNWDIFKCYKFVHFRSMYSKNSVIWLNNTNDIAQKIEDVLNDKNKQHIENAQKWFEVINQHPPEKASERIWNAIEEIIKQNQ